MSEIRATTVSDLAGTGPATLTGQYAAKAWVNFNGTGTVAIRASGNVSSITDNGVGNYTVNFTTALADANYAAVAHCKNNGVSANGSYTNLGNDDPVSGSCRIFALVAGGGSVQDVSWITATITR